jgi:hypothetical protein
MHCNSKLLNLYFKGFVCGQTEQLYDSIYAAEKGETVLLENYFLIPVKEGGVKFLNLSQDERQLIVGVTKGLLLIYHVSDIVKKVELNLLLVIFYLTNAFLACRRVTCSISTTQ